MIISAETLKPLLPENVHPAIAHNRVARFFCTPNNINGHCIMDCKTCIPYLEQVLRNLEEAQDPIALIVYRLRSASANLADSHPHQATPPTDGWGLPIERNPFETILKEFI